MSVAASSSMDSVTVPLSTSLDQDQTNQKHTSERDLIAVFSDVDGTLVHYPSDLDLLPIIKGNRILQLPPSATGLRGVISSITLQRCQEIRQEGVALILVSGMRTTTLMKRLPYLPKADAYCSEAGGRIFYPVQSGARSFTPEAYDGADDEALKPFGLSEDLKWKALMSMEDAAGKDGYSGNEILDFKSVQKPVSEREGLLWTFATDLLRRGYILDTDGYSCCFRINEKQQTNSSLFNLLLNGAVSVPSGLSTSTNLGCVDFYPNTSGKKNCCQYIAQKLSGGLPDVLSDHCVCLCDDDNDIEMATACAHAYLPDVSSTSLADMIRSNPSQFTRTQGNGVEGTAATDAALALVLQRI